MTPNPIDRQIFNPKLRRLRRERAARRTGDFILLKRAAEDVAERIADVNRRFQNALIIGLPAFRQELLARLSSDKTPTRITELDDWPESFKSRENYDLIISGLVLQSWNDLPEAIASGRIALVPDGLFLASIIGGESLLGLKRACFAADQERHGGIIPRVAPMVSVQQAALLMGRAGFAQPVIDRDECKFAYAKIQTLVEDLRDIGETNCLMAYEPVFERRDFEKRISRGFSDRDHNDRYLCIFEILWLTGWAPHDSQQKPLKPGSAKTRLSDALRKIRD